MDKCTAWELNDIIDNLPYLDRNIWETARLNAWSVVNGYTKNRIKQQDILKFKWEEENKEDFEQKPEDIEISDEDIQRLKEISKQWEKQS